MPELPEELRRYFQEYDGRRLSWEESRPTIVGRLLEAGGWDAVQWLRAHLGEEELTGFIQRRGGRGISPRRLRFWGLILDIPRDRVDRWIAAQQAEPWGQRRMG